MNKIKRYFPNSDLRSQHDGLTKQALRADMNPEELKNGEFLVFVNRKRDRLKMYGAGNALAFVKMRKGERIDPRVIQHLPRHFGGSKINYDAAMKDVMMEHFPSWFKK